MAEPDNVYAALFRAQQNYPKLERDKASQRTTTNEEGTTWQR